MDYVKEDYLLGNKKIIVGDKLHDMVLENLGRIYIRYGNSYKEFNSIINSLTASTSSPHKIIIEETGLEDVSSYKNGQLVYDATAGILYLVYNGEFLILIEYVNTNSSKYVRKTGDTMSGVLVINTKEAPLQVYSTDLINNMNVEYLGGHSAKEFAQKANDETITGNWTFNGENEFNAINRFNKTAVFSGTKEAAIRVGQGALITDGDIGSSQFTSGYTGNGWRLSADTNTLEIDNLIVRGILNVYELVVNKITATNGAFWVTDSFKVSSIQPLEFLNCSDDAQINQLNSKTYYIPYSTEGDNYEEQVLDYTTHPLATRSSLTSTEDGSSFIKFKYLFQIISAEEFKSKITTLEQYASDSVLKDSKLIELTDIYGGNFDNQIYRIIPLTDDVKLNETNDSYIYNPTTDIADVNLYYKYFGAIYTTSFSDPGNLGLYILETEDGEYPVLKPGDILRCQKFNGKSVKQYHAIVLNNIGGTRILVQMCRNNILNQKTSYIYNEDGSLKSSSEEIDENLYKRSEDYIDDKEDYNVDTANANTLGAPEKDDALVRIGSIFPGDRQNSLYLTSSSDNSPYEDVMVGMNRPDTGVVYCTPRYKTFIKGQKTYYLQDSTANKSDYTDIADLTGNVKTVWKSYNFTKNTIFVNKKPLVVDGYYINDKETKVIEPATKTKNDSDKITITLGTQEYKIIEGVYVLKGLNKFEVTFTYNDTVVTEGASCDITYQYYNETGTLVSATSNGWSIILLPQRELFGYVKVTYNGLIYYKNFDIHVVSTDLYETLSTATEIPIGDTALLNTDTNTLNDNSWGCSYITGHEVIEQDSNGNYLTEQNNPIKVRLGNLTGIYNYKYGIKQPHGYGLYGENVFLTGDFYLNNGKSLMDISDTITLAVGDTDRAENNLENLNNQLQDLYNTTNLVNDSLENLSNGIDGKINTAKEELEKAQQTTITNYISNNKDSIFHLGLDYSLWALGNAGISLINPNVKYKDKTTDLGQEVDQSTVGDGDEYILLQGDKVQINTYINKDDFKQVVYTDINPESWDYDKLTEGGLFKPAGVTLKTGYISEIPETVNSVEGLHYILYNEQYYSFSSYYIGSVYETTESIEPLTNQYFVFDVESAALFENGKINAKYIEVQDVLAIQNDAIKNPDFKIEQEVVYGENYPVKDNGNFVAVSGSTGKIYAKGGTFEGNLIVGNKYDETNPNYIELSNNFTNGNTKNIPAISIYSGQTVSYTIDGESKTTTLHNESARFSGIVNNEPLSIYTNTNSEKWSTQLSKEKTINYSGAVKAELVGSDYQLKLSSTTSDDLVILFENLENKDVLNLEYDGLATIDMTAKLCGTTTTNPTEILSTAKGGIKISLQMKLVGSDDWGTVEGSESLYTCTLYKETGNKVTLVTHNQNIKINYKYSIFYPGTYRIIAEPYYEILPTGNISSETLGDVQFTDSSDSWGINGGQISGYGVTVKLDTAGNKLYWDSKNYKTRLLGNGLTLGFDNKNYFGSYFNTENSHMILDYQCNGYGQKVDGGYISNYVAGNLIRGFTTILQGRIRYTTNKYYTFEGISIMNGETYAKGNTTEYSINGACYYDGKDLSVIENKSTYYNDIHDLYLTRVNTGSILLNFGDEWGKLLNEYFCKEENIFVNATGIGRGTSDSESTSKITNGPLYVTVRAIQSSYLGSDENSTSSNFTIGGKSPNTNNWMQFYISDDSTLNDGSFFIQISYCPNN